MGEEAGALPEVVKWGLDPSFWCYLKLAVQQIQSLPEHPEHHGCFVLGNRVVTKVNILGDIVSVHEREKNIVFSVDDGSAVISCIIWKNRDETDWDVLTEGLQLGKVVCVLGRINIFREERQINVTSWRSVKDVHAQCMHWLSIVQLHRDIYDTPATYNYNPEPPSASAQPPSFTGAMSSGYAGTLEEYFQKHAADGKTLKFTDLLEQSHLVEEAMRVLGYSGTLKEEQSKRLIRFISSSVRQLVCKGLLFHSDIVADEYCVVSIDKHLVPVVRAILRNACSHGNQDMDEKAVVAAVRGQQMWMHITVEQIREALRMCVLENYAYDTGGGGYRPL